MTRKGRLEQECLQCIVHYPLILAVKAESPIINDNQLMICGFLTKKRRLQLLLCNAQQVTVNLSCQSRIANSHYQVFKSCLCVIFCRCFVIQFDSYGPICSHVASTYIPKDEGGVSLECDRLYIGFNHSRSGCLNTWDYPTTSELKKPLG